MTDYFSGTTSSFYDTSGRRIEYKKNPDGSITIPSSAVKNNTDLIDYLSGKRSTTTSPSSTSSSSSSSSGLSSPLFGTSSSTTDYSQIFRKELSSAEAALAREMGIMYKNIAKRNTQGDSFEAQDSDQAQGAAGASEAGDTSESSSASGANGTSGADQSKSSGQITEDFDIRTKYTGTAEDLEKKLPAFLKGKGELLMKLQEKYNVNPLVLISIARLESGNGTSRLAKENNNIGGLKCKGNANGWQKFASIDDCLEEMAKVISGYKIEGKHTIAAVGKIYCADAGWDSQVAKIASSYA